MPTLYDHVDVLKGLGKVGATTLAKAGVRTIRDLLFYFPYRYEDFSHIVSIADLHAGSVASFIAEVVSVEVRDSFKSRVKVTEALVKDETGEISIKWFNQPFLVKTLLPGTRVSFSGRVDVRDGLVLANPRYEVLRTPKQETIHTGCIVPIYSRSATVGEKRLRLALRQALPAVRNLVDRLPESLRDTEHFLSLQEAIETIHVPTSMPQLECAIERLKFDELFFHQLLFAEMRRDLATRLAYEIPIDEDRLKAFVQSLPFTLTAGQKIAAWEIVQDMSRAHPMNRLLEGDVGSGKTVVSAFAIDTVLSTGFQVAYLAPTEVLARQQWGALCRLLPHHQVALLTRVDCRLGEEKIARAELLQRIADGEALVVVATHALLQNEWQFPRLALLIVDEQHRFGVRQRHELLARQEGMAPHLLSMSATPIPRSLALSIYGDLDLSIMKELPVGRLPIQTRIVSDRDEGAMYEEIRKELDGAGRAYVICPLIDPSDALGVQSVTEATKRLRATHLRGVEIALLHGRMKPDEKEEAMRAFKEGRVKVLVATTVVEVGVDVPEATVIVIEGAERFGLAQLHQLRGRVGRSDRPSKCYLRPTGWVAGLARERLQAVVTCQSGFQLAEMDLKFRGPGNVFGNAQSGFPDFQLATLADVDLMKKARDEAGALLEEDPLLEAHPLLKDYVVAKSDELHLE